MRMLINSLKIYFGVLLRSTRFKYDKYHIIGFYDTLSNKLKLARLVSSFGNNHMNVCFKH